MTKKELQAAIDFDLYEADEDTTIVWSTDALDLTDSEKAELNGARYVVYVEQYCYNYPVPSHFEPVPAEFNDMVAGQLGI